MAIVERLWICNMLFRNDFVLMLKLFIKVYHKNDSIFQPKPNLFHSKQQTERTRS